VRVWLGAKNLSSTRIRSPDSPAYSHFAILATLSWPKHK
jgi:hypothetical protein